MSCRGSMRTTHQPGITFPSGEIKPTAATGSHRPAANPINSDIVGSTDGARGTNGRDTQRRAVSSERCHLGEGVTVSPLDGGQEWDVPAQELEAGWKAVSGGAQLDGLASIRLQEAGVGSAHPEYVAGLLRAVIDKGT